MTLLMVLGMDRYNCRTCDVWLMKSNDKWYCPNCPDDWRVGGERGATESWTDHPDVKI